MNKPELRRLERIEVDRLFGIYDHRIHLKIDDHLTLLHGLNGVGKTVLLCMIDALLNARLSYFRRIPFSRFAIHFHDGSDISLHKPTMADDPSTLRLYTNDKEEISSQVYLSTRAEQVAESISILRPHPAAPGYWVDIRDGEQLSSAEIISRYGDQFPPSGNSGDSPQELPWLSAFLETANTHMIQAQRLFKFGLDSTAPLPLRHRQFFPGALASTVDEYRQDFRARLAQTMADYGRQSQALDQSFPQRLITAQEEMAVETLEHRISELERKTTELTNIGILEKTQTPPISVGKLTKIDHTQARVMTLYVHDTTKKLAELDNLKDRSRLLLDKMNQKYQHKSIRVDSEHGLVAMSDDRQRLDLDYLSSGEQHELVLYYDLLFRVPSNTIVLIDEPELSLHVKWQKEFIPDLLEIVELAGFDALIATHSPYIVGDRTDLMVGLGGSG